MRMVPRADQMLADKKNRALERGPQEYLKMLAPIIQRNDALFAQKVVTYAVCLERSSMEK